MAEAKWVKWKTIDRGREWKIKTPPLSLVWGWHAAGTEHVHPAKVFLLSLTWLPVCVLCASLHYSWHLWFHALHTPHGRSFSFSDSSSLPSPLFITHLVCSITILINLTSVHIRTAVSLLLLTKCWITHAECDGLGRVHSRVIKQTHWKH